MLKMKNPKEIKTIVAGATYEVPTYLVNDAGLVDGDGAIISFCKGDRNNPEIQRQEGFFTETLIQVAKEYLESVNVGQLATRETSMAITKLDEALMWIQKRAEDRQRRSVQGTYQK
jgi:hypothetical protein